MILERMGEKTVLTHFKASSIHFTGGTEGIERHNISFSGRISNPGLHDYKISVLIPAHVV
jgi:hypothetical protein